MSAVNAATRSKTIAVRRPPNIIFSPEHRILVALLVAQRRTAGISQRTLAARLGRSPSHVGMIERGQRRVETIEFSRIAKALHADPVVVFEALMDRLAAPRPHEES